MTEPALIIDPKNETPRQRRLRLMTRQRHSAEKELICSTYRFPREAHLSLQGALRAEGLTVKDIIWEALRNACLQRDVECTLNTVQRGPVPPSAKQVLSQEAVCNDPETALSARSVNGSGSPLKKPPEHLDILLLTGKRASYRTFLDKILNNTAE